MTPTSPLTVLCPFCGFQQPCDVAGIVVRHHDKTLVRVGGKLVSRSGGEYCRGTGWRVGDLLPPGAWNAAEGRFTP